mmetsp:Transcript_40436/g.47314  ORF Transcript_40436/g.47314 Transcript_40436/m.47314 type:complete len:132 (+) Transcript_40436:1352-1747(+)
MPDATLLQDFLFEDASEHTFPSLIDCSKWVFSPLPRIANPDSSCSDALLHESEYVLSDSPQNKCGVNILLLHFLIPTLAPLSLRTISSICKSITCFPSSSWKLSSVDKLVRCAFHTYRYLDQQEQRAHCMH